MDPIQDTMELMDAIQNKIDQASQLQTALYQIPVPASMPNGVRSDIDKVAESVDGAKRGLEGIKLRLQDRFNKLTAERRRLSALEVDPKKYRGSRWYAKRGKWVDRQEVIAMYGGYTPQIRPNKQYPSGRKFDYDELKDPMIRDQVPPEAWETEPGPRRLPTVTYYTGGQSKTYTYDSRLKQFRYLVYGKKPEYIEPGNPLYYELMDLLKGDLPGGRRRL